MSQSCIHNPVSFKFSCGNLSVEKQIQLFVRSVSSLWHTMPGPTQTCCCGKAKDEAEFAPQVRFIARGTKGTFTKFGVDGQEDQLKAMASPNAVFDDSYGAEPESLWGSVETLNPDGTTTTRV